MAGDPKLPVNAVALIASPFDFTQVRIMAPIRPVANVTNGLLLSAVYRALGGAPAPIVKRAFQLSSIDKYVTKPLAVLSNLHDRDFLAQIEAVDHFTNNMHAYPGRTMGQLYHRFFRVNDLADGVLDLGERTIALADVRVPVLSVAGTTDVLAPRPAVHHVGSCCPTLPRSGSRPRPAAISASSPGARPSARRGRISTTSSPTRPPARTCSAACASSPRPRLPSRAMARRLLVLAAGLAVLAAVPARAQDDRVIAAGVSSGGVQLGGLTVDAAAAKLASVLTPHLMRDVVLGAGGRPYRLSAVEARLRFDALLTAKRAAQVKPAATPAGGGAPAGAIVPPALSHSRLAVRAWAGRVARAVYRAPRNATLRMTLRHMSLRRARLGKALDRTAAAAAADAALDDADASRVLHQRLRTVRPAVNADDLRRIYRTVVTVDRSSFTLRLFKNLRLRKRYGIAVGMAGLDTPAGATGSRTSRSTPPGTCRAAPGRAPCRGRPSRAGRPTTR